MTEYTLSQIYNQLLDVEFVPVLSVFAWTGVTSFPQLETATGLTRKRLERTLGYLINLDIVSRSEMPAKAIKMRGRSSAVYVLEERGADILRDLKLKPDAHACRLKQPAELAHALSLTHVAALAQAAQLTFAVEGHLPFGDAEHIRPDLLITLPTNERAIFEIEQYATAADTTQRLVDKLRRLVRFFHAPQSQGVSRNICVLFNVEQASWLATRRVWVKVVAAVAAEEQGALPFTLWGRLLADFIRQPEWTVTDRFEDLLDPSLLPTFKAQFAEDEQQPSAAPISGNAFELFAAISKAQSQARSGAALQLPDSPLTLDAVLPDEFGVYRTALLHNDLTLLSAYYAVFTDELFYYRSGSPAQFFQLMELIYAASYHRSRSAVARTGLPFGSLLMLRTYLDQPDRSDLRKALVMGLKRVEGSRYRGINMVRDQMTRLCWGVFLAYHGLARGGALRVNVQVPDEECSEIHIAVRISSIDLLLGEEDVLPFGEPGLAEQSLAWVLEALVTYTELLGLR